MTSTDHPPVGIDHLTVVPKNFGPEEHRSDHERNEQGTERSGKTERADPADARFRRTSG